jgi:tRNA (guanine-N7-)-methyltransferase
MSASGLARVADSGGQKENEQRARKRGQLFGRRKGPKLSARQMGLRRTLLGELAYRPGDDPLPQFPNTVRELWLEVGFGAGEHLVWQAEHHPGVGLIGAEPYETGVAKLLTKLEESKLNTVRIYEGDGREILEALPDQSLGRFFLLFPDPWPKTRHHKRRFLQMEMLDQLARVLKPGAELRFATDDKTYLPYALERLMAHPGFNWLVDGPSDWKSRPADWPPTRYEAKAIKGPPTFLRFARC